MKAAVLCALFASSVAFAADLKPSQEEAKTAFDKQWKAILEEVNAACGTKFDAVQTDFENWDKKNFVRTTAGTACSMCIERSLRWKKRPKMFGKRLDSQDSRTAST